MAVGGGGMFFFFLREAKKFVGSIIFTPSFISVGSSVLRVWMSVCKCVWK